MFDKAIESFQRAADALEKAANIDLGQVKQASNAETKHALYAQVWGQVDYANQLHALKGGGHD